MDFNTSTDDNLVLIAQELSLSGLRKEITEIWEHGNVVTWNMETRTGITKYMKATNYCTMCITYGPILAWSYSFDYQSVTSSLHLGITYGTPSGLTRHYSNNGRISHYTAILCTHYHYVCTRTSSHNIYSIITQTCGHR